MSAALLRTCALLSAIAALAFGSVLVGAPPAAATRRASVARSAGPGLMLALGDSLAAGYQPTDGRNPPPVDPATGWPDQGYPHGYASDLAAAEHLELIDLGCPGETTTSYTTVPAQPECEKVYSGELGASNQQAAALAVLAAHLHEVRLVTFDLGANDLDACLSGTTVDAGCLFARSSAVLARLPHLLATIRAALERDDPGARLAAMDYYDPFLGLAEDPGGLKGTALATLSVGVLETFDASLRAIYAHAGAVVVDVSSAFQTGAVLPLTGYDGKQLPRDVALVCRWTYMCPAPGTSGATASPDIHPNDAGYARIAAAFQAALAPR